MIEATCHCGAVRLSIVEPPARVTSCNCSVCRRIGALWAYYRPEQVRIAPSDRATIAYVRGDGLIEFHHCSTCGCLTHYEGVDKARSERIGVNARMMEPEALAGVRVRRFDGASSWTEAGEEDVPWSCRTVTGVASGG
ncbi:MAG: GFA family protein [Pseudomonadota bacterium]|nr:GFA family protein [Pseudomonadota bacterium]